MSWNPFRKRESEESDPAELAGNGQPADGGVGDGDDATDPLVQVGHVEERCELLREQNGIRLERVEVWGPAGLSDAFIRLLVREPGPHTDKLRALLLDGPEEVTGFRDLLVRDDCALAAALELPDSDLASLLARPVGAAARPRAIDLLRGLRSFAQLCTLLEQEHGLYWQHPSARQIGVVAEGPTDPAGLCRHRLLLGAWDQLSGDRVEPAALAVLLATQLHQLRTEAAEVEFVYGVEQLGLLLEELERLTAPHDLTYAQLADGLSALSVRFTAGSATDPGQVRAHNEDAALLLTLDQQSFAGARLTLAAVADGMGGHLSGEVASSLALDLLRQQLGMGLLAPRSTPIELGRLGEQLESIIPAIDRALTERAQLEPRLAGMGTTLAGLAVLRRQSTTDVGGSGECAAVFHVGDSRAYLLTGDGPRRLTRDHSYVQQLLDSGAIGPDEAFSHPQKNVITRCLGGGTSDSAPDVSAFTPGFGEIVLLCSDGLTDVLRDDELWHVVGEAGTADLDALAHALVAAANAGGGPDNITVVLIGCGL